MRWSRRGEDVPSFEEVRARLRAFVDERDWDQFHTPKDLALSIAVEAGELLEVFQWREGALTSEEQARVREELADVVLYAMLLADKTRIDLPEALAAKIERNTEKYPADKARGRADKYDRL